MGAFDFDTSELDLAIAVLNRDFKNKNNKTKMGETKQSKLSLQKQIDDIKKSIENIESENAILQKFAEIKTVELGM